MRKVWTPRKFQPAGIQHILDHKRCALFASMGSGKSVMTLTALDIMFLAGVETKPAIVFAPLRVAKDTWSDEAARWVHLRGITVSPIVGTADERRAALARKANVYTCNFENIDWLATELDGAWPFGMVIIDESSRVKSFRGSETSKKKRTKKGEPEEREKGVKGQGSKRALTLAKMAFAKSTRWLNLTGTPAPNGLQDLWGAQWYLDSGDRLGRTFTAFKNRWFRAVPGSDGYHQIEIMPFSEAQIHAAIKDVCLTIDMTSHYDIGEFIDHTIFVDLPPKAAKAYKEMEKKLYTELTSGEKIEALTAASKSQKLLQAAGGAFYLGEAGDYVGDRPFEVLHDEKLLALESIVEEAAGMPLLVAYQHKSDLARLLKWFPKGRHFDKNPKTKADFIAGKIPLLFIHPGSGGHGVDGLQHGTNIIVFFSQDWKLEDYQQVSERIGPTRQFQSGYKRPAFRYHICARKSIDEVVMERRKSNSTVQDALLEYLKRKDSEK